MTAGRPFFICQEAPHVANNPAAFFINGVGDYFQLCRVSRAKGQPPGNFLRDQQTGEREGAHDSGKIHIHARKGDKKDP